MVNLSIDPVPDLVIVLYASFRAENCPWYLCALPIFNACAMPKYSDRNKRKWYLQMLRR
ncbi:hypothetical protein HBH69_095190 [Parastagonospora nodorum]|nr:hypothetical protein HBI95_016680 [Parastagonospora nodorum]KAH4260855.1 hypothetical protein HBI03_122660 [Parastagonospora nodorum]KAH4281561.1 hypothetical protein HBI04_040030 [Parastagonospora nodorum]KAH5156260.1 hypothetical protein HBH69_095190 [Parastagonospora nodorum]KAH5231266.1 hypothetical protein HBI62_076780 [Parastagonospora nodorum]